MIRAILLHLVCLSAAYLDARTTRHIITHGGSEMNPVLQQVVHHRTLWYGTKLSVNLLAVADAERRRRRGDRYWYTAELIAASSQSLAAASNLRQIRIHNDHLDRKAWLP